MNNHLAKANSIFSSYENGLKPNPIDLDLLIGHFSSFYLPLFQLSQNQLPPAQLFSAQLPPNQLTPALAGGRIDCVLLALAKIFHHNFPMNNHLAKANSIFFIIREWAKAQSY